MLLANRVAIITGGAGVNGLGFTTARMMAIVSQLAIIAGMVVIGWRHFDNLRLGMIISC